CPDWTVGCFAPPLGSSMMQTMPSQNDHSGQPLRVLTADPDADARALYRRALGHGFDFIEASDGRDALVKALVRVPALVVTEIHLPVMGGIALCEILRRDRTTARVPIVVATAERRLNDLSRAHEYADVVLPKPTDGSAFAAECLRLL